MLQKTRAIVLRQTKYSETSLIVRMYTSSHGLQSFIANGVRSAKGRSKAALLQAPNLLDVVMYYKESRDLHRLREFKPAVIFQRIPFDIVRSTLALFIVEVLNKSLKEQAGNPELFAFLERSLARLDAEESAGLSLYPHIFLLELARFLGFRPHGHFSDEETYFDMQEGMFSSLQPLTHFLENDTAADLSACLACGEWGQPWPSLPRERRKFLLSKILDYYRLHLENFNKLNAPAILEQVLR